MTKRIFTTSLIFTTLFSVANAQTANYECHAKANAERGLDFDFSISVSPAKVGGQMTMKAPFGQKVIGVISEVGVLSQSDAAQKPAFDASLGLISEEDVSGITKSDLGKVNSIEILKAKTSQGDEAIVYKLLDTGKKQIGGTVLISGLGTSCLPK